LKLGRALELAPWLELPGSVGLRGPRELPRPLELPRILELRWVLELTASLELTGSLELPRSLGLSCPLELRGALELRRAGECDLPRWRELSGIPAGRSAGESDRRGRLRRWRRRRLERAELPGAGNLTARRRHGHRPPGLPGLGRPRLRLLLPARGEPGTRRRRRRLSHGAGNLVSGARSARALPGRLAAVGRRGGLPGWQRPRAPGGQHGRPGRFS
jgi:hypothetical protein